jgi:hypothetical protein
MPSRVSATAAQVPSLLQTPDAQSAATRHGASDSPEHAPKNPTVTPRIYDRMNDLTLVGLGGHAGAVKGIAAPA